MTPPLRMFAIAAAHRTGARAWRSQDQPLILQEMCHFWEKDGQNEASRCPGAEAPGAASPYLRHREAHREAPGPPGEVHGAVRCPLQRLAVDVGGGDLPA